MKKQILIVFTGAMELGGIERSLIGLLDAIDYTKYDVDLFLYAHRGPLFEQINKHVNILPEVKELSYLRESLKDKIRNGCYYSAFLRIIDGLKSYGRELDHDESWFKVLDKFACVNPKEYDLAISFFMPFDYIKSKVNANIKIGWIHTDYSSINPNLTSLRNQYDNLDLIAAVSEDSKKSFLNLLPQLKNKTIVIENILSKENIFKMSNESIPDIYDNESVNLLSIGRFCTAKNFDNIPEICKLILEKGLNIKWYLIGFGADERLIKEKITEFKMEDHVIILGKKENPYPYIKACDAYIQPSRYEGKCVAVREAQILEKPVIITNYATATSQLKDGFDGVIVPMDNQACADEIYNVLNDKALISKLIKNCSKGNYTNEKEIEKLYKIISCF